MIQDTNVRRIVILMSDTGGGHRSAAEAISAALACQFPGRYQVILFDAIARAAVFPFNHAPDWYLPLVSLSERLWGLLFQATNNRLVGACTPITLKILMGRGLKTALRKQAPDLVVSTHPLLTTFPRRLLREMGLQTPFATVVTDLFTGHTLWFDCGVDLCTVPTEEARKVASQAGVPSEKLHVTGQPVSLKFLESKLSQTAARSKLGLALELKTILLVGGGEGMGPLYEIARAIDRAHLPAQLVIITGRNAPLHHKLQASTWQMPTQIQGFVTNMPEWMHASDVIVTKAGPGTIAEAMACGLPILLSGFLPGQETGNVTFVEQSGIGVLRTEPADIARTLGEWLTPGNDTLARYAARAQHLAHPDAALKIAELLDGLLAAPRSRVRSEWQAT